MSEIIHQEVLELLACPEQVKAFIMTPERILDYYPGGLHGGTLEPGKTFYCQGKSGVSLLALMDNSNDQHLILKVTTANGLKPPFTREAIEQAAFFTMIEDWELSEHNGGTRLTKTWRDLKKHKMRWLPLGWIIRSSAKSESRRLIKGWNQAAERFKPAQGAVRE